MGLEYQKQGSCQVATRSTHAAPPRRMTIRTVAGTFPGGYPLSGLAGRFLSQLWERSNWSMQ